MASGSRVEVGRTVDNGRREGYKKDRQRAEELRNRDGGIVSTIMQSDLYLRGGLRRQMLRFLLFGRD